MAHSNSVFVHLRSCLVSRPPLVVFILSLFAFALTTFILAVIVNEGGELSNPDSFDWNTFFFKLSELDFCVNDDGPPVRLTENGNSENNTSVSLFVPVSTSFLKILRSSLSGVALAHGSILIDHMDRGRLGKYRGMTVDLTFNLTGQVLDSPPQEQQLHQNVCISVAGPRLLLDDLNLGRTPSECKSPAAATNAVSFVTHAKEHLPSDWCLNKTSMTLTYQLQPEWTVYVSASDRNLIHLHLLCTSAFLFVLATSVLLVILAKGVKQQQLKTKSVGDGRGDAHFLLPQD